MCMFVSKRRARTLSNVVLLLGLAFVVFFESWWPDVLFVIGLSFALKDFLLKKWHDFFVNILVFGGLFLYFHYNVRFNLNYIIPVGLTVAALYILYKEFLIPKRETEVEIEEEINKEIEEDTPH